MLEGDYKMRNVRVRVARNRVQMPSSDTASREADDVKNAVRDSLLLMTWDEQVEFIEALESDMRRVDLSITHYLIPLGIPGIWPEELAPTEVGHLVRFLKILVPQAMPAVERAMARLEAFREYEKTRQPLA